MANRQMTSKERMLAAINFKDVDYIPCSIYFNPNMKKFGYNASNIEEAVKFYLDLGVDPFIQLPLADSKIDVETRVWTEEIKGEAHPILFKEYKTPDGLLRMGVRLTSEWPFGNDIPFPGDDFCASHMYEPLIKAPEDVDLFKYLMKAPKEEDFLRVKSKFDQNKKAADKYGILTIGTVSFGLGTLMFLMGAENMVCFAIDYPDEFKKLSQIVSDAAVAKIKLAKDQGIDLFKRFGGYEQTNFISPSIYKDVVVPALENEYAAAKQVDIPMYYRVVTGMKPLLDMISGVGFNAVEGFEPCLSDCSNKDIYDKLGGKACIWTGVSSPGHLGADSDIPARKAVREAIETFGRKGFILGVTNSIRSHWPFENTLAMIDEWKKVR